MVDLKAVRQVAEQLIQSRGVLRDESLTGLDGGQERPGAVGEPVDRLGMQAVKPDPRQLRHELPVVRRREVAAGEVGADLRRDARRQGRQVGRLRRVVRVRRRCEEGALLLLQIAGLAVDRVREDPIGDPAYPGAHAQADETQQLEHHHAPVRVELPDQEGDDHRQPAKRDRKSPGPVEGAGHRRGQAGDGRQDQRPARAAAAVEGRPEQEQASSGHRRGDAEAQNRLFRVHQEHSGRLVSLGSCP